MLGLGLTLTSFSAPNKVSIVTLPDGSAASPSLCFASDPSSGFFMTNGVVCLSVHGSVVAAFDKNRNVALAGATIGPSSSDSLAAGRGSQANSDCAIALGQKAYVGAYDGVSLGHNNYLDVPAIASFAAGTDNYINAPYATTIGDGNEIYVSAIGATAIGAGNLIGENALTDRGQYSATFGLGNQTLGVACFASGTLLGNRGDNSALFGKGVGSRNLLINNLIGVIGIGYNTTSPVVFP